MDIYLLINGVQEGPYAKEQLRESLAIGHIQGDLPAWNEGLTEWVPVSSIIATRPTLMRSPEPTTSTTLPRSSKKLLLPLYSAGLFVVTLISVVIVHHFSGIRGNYSTADGSQTLAIVSSSDLECRFSDGTIIPGKYKLDGDFIRVEVTISGTPQVMYLKRVEQGLQEPGGPLYLSTYYYEKIQKETYLKEASSRATDELAHGDNNSAITDYSKAIELSPSDPSAFEGRGKAESDAGDFKKAILDFTQAISLSSDSSSKYHRERSWAELAFGDLQGAKDDLERFSDDDTRLSLWIIESKLGDEKQANVELSSALDRGWQSEATSQTTLDAQFLVGRLNENDFLFSSAHNSKAGEETGEAWFYLGIKKLVEGDKVGAKVDFQNCIAQQNNYFYGMQEEAKRELATLGEDTKAP